MAVIQKNLSNGTDFWNKTPFNFVNANFFWSETLSLCLELNKLQIQMLRHVVTIEMLMSYY